jgi:uncharacterized protein (UPF0128 family)
MADPHHEAKIFEQEVQPRILRMRKRLAGMFHRGNIPVQPHRMDMNQGGLPLSPPDRLMIIAHVLHELTDIEKTAGSDDAVRMAAQFYNEQAGRHALYRVQCLENMLFPLGLYMLREIVSTMASQKKAA